MLALQIEQVLLPPQGVADELPVLPAGTAATFERPRAFVREASQLYDGARVRVSICSVIEEDKKGGKEVTGRAETGVLHDDLVHQSQLCGMCHL